MREGEGWERDRKREENQAREENNLESHFPFTQKGNVCISFGFLFCLTFNVRIHWEKEERRKRKGDKKRKEEERKEREDWESRLCQPRVIHLQIFDS